MLSRSQSGSKRSRLDEARQRLLKLFDGGPQQAVTQLPAEERLQAAFELATDITEFAQKYAAHYLVDQDTQQPVEPAAFHAEVYELLLTEMRLAVAAPREHAKSTVVSLIFVLYCVCYKLRRFIVLISSTEPQAILQLNAVKEELETNDAIRKDFGDLVGDKKWGERDFETSTGVRLSARGAGQSLRGLRKRQFRPDLVICDDLEEDELVENPESRKKLLNWFRRTVLNLGQNCQVIVIGTILHYDSLLAHLLSADGFRRFTKRFYVAVDDDWSPASVLWPGKWSLEDLKAKEEDIGAVDFDQEFRNRPINAATQEFKEEWVKQHAYTEAEFRTKKIVRVLTAVDPGISRKKKTFGIATIAIDSDGFIYARTVEQKQMRFVDQVKYAMHRFDMDGPEKLGVDTNAYQLALKDQLDEESRKSQRYIPVEEIKATGEKLTRITALAPLAENGTLRFRLDGSHDTVLKQLYFLGKIATDAADALEMAVRLARGTRKGAMACADAQEPRQERRRGLMEESNEQRAQAGAYTQRCVECGDVVVAFRQTEAGDGYIKVRDCRQCGAPLPPKELPQVFEDLPAGHERWRFAGAAR